MQKEFFKKALSVLGVFMASLFPVFGQYITVNVDAPFPMDPIKEFIYPQNDFSILEYGAVEGGKADNTFAIAKAIDACHKAGGGRVVIPEGEWLTGPVHLKMLCYVLRTIHLIICLL